MVLRCPANTRQYPAEQYDPWNPNLGYGVNYNTILNPFTNGSGGSAAWYNPANTRKITRLRLPQRYVFFMDRQIRNQRRINYVDTLMVWSPTSGGLSAVHTNKGNYLMGDGSITHLAGVQVWAHMIGHSSIPWQSGNPGTLYDKAMMFDPRW